MSTPKKDHEKAATTLLYKFQALFANIEDMGRCFTVGAQVLPEWTTDEVKKLTQFVDKSDVALTNIKRCLYETSLPYVNKKPKIIVPENADKKIVIASS